MFLRILSVVVATILFCYIFVVAFFFKDAGVEGICRNFSVVVKDSADKHFVTEAELVYLLKQANLYAVGQPMKSINTHQIETVLLKNEMIADVQAYKTPSGTVRLNVKQKIPVLRVISSRGNYYVDDKGGMMPLSNRYVAHLPVASGYIEKELAVTDLYKFALFLQENDFWNDQIEQIYVHPNREVELIPRVGNHRIRLGTFDHFEEKLANLQLFYKQAIPKTGWDKYSIINLKYKGQIVCTKKNKQI
ncbi:MAG: cell division protein FtsQ [Tannerellaceae bacterium]|jgi:cell division protein FtsQ|nr:cell division protein FtsQ [Tannerellaceae bacterium]